MKLRRIVLKGAEARNKLAAGVKFASDLIGGTVGPFGYNVFLDKQNKVTNDGAKIIAEVVLDDEVENRGVIALKEVATKTNDQVGDGTTTATLLAGAIYSALSHKLSDETKGKIGGISPSQLIKQVEAERMEIEAKLDAMAEPITTEAQLIDSATVSVEDRALGELIGKIQWELGKEGTLLAEETPERTSSVERVKGIRIDNGLGTSIVMNNQEKQCLEAENSKVILTNHTLTDLKPLQKILDQLIKAGFKTITIVARAFSQDAIQICMKNIQGGIHIFPVNAPYVDQAEIMRDMAVILGGTFYDQEERSLEDIQLSDVGFAKKVIAYRYNAIFVGEGKEEQIAARTEELKQKLTGAYSDFEKRNLTSRISQLTNGFALVKVGSHSEMERKRLYDKCEDAVQAVKAAYQEGVVPGAGLAFKAISDELPTSSLLKIPLLALNEQITASAPEGWKPEAWVKDPVKVLKTALKSACEVASVLASAGGVITAKNPDRLADLLRPNNEEHG